MKVLFVTDNPSDLIFFDPLFQHDGIETILGAFDDASVVESQPDAVILDPNYETGQIQDFLTRMDILEKKTKIIIITPVEGTSMPLSSKHEIYQLRKPFDIEELIYLLKDKRQIDLPRYGDTVRDGVFAAASPAMKAVYELVKQVAPTDASVLITGETGTGKEVIASLLHAHSRRAEKELVAMNCAAIPDSLLESELFGYEKGAFTGAAIPRPGKFEYAHGSTLFLDEIGDMPLTLQAKVLRVIQEKKVQRLGSNTYRQADTRILAATNKDLELMMKDQTFREDLYYRLNVIKVHLPPLRERRDDLVFLADMFLKKFASKYGKNSESISPEAMDILLSYTWPGNIRELQNLMESMVILSRNRIIMPGDIPQQIRPRVSQVDSPSHIHLSQDLKSLEKNAVENALKEAGGNKMKAARILGISRRTLYNKLEKYGIS